MLVVEEKVKPRTVVVCECEWKWKFSSACGEKDTPPPQHTPTHHTVGLVRGKTV
jgi:hypothetical protein